MCSSIHVVKLIETEYTIAVAGDGGGKQVKLVCRHYRASDAEDEKVLELDIGDGCSTMLMLLLQ